MAKARFELDGNLGEIVLTDPPLNLTGRELIDDLREATQQARASSARAILVRAEGDNFCAGADVQIFRGLDKTTARQLVTGFVKGLHEFEQLGVPSVAAVNGLCLAAGLELALLCDLIWAGDDSRLGLVESVIGATPFGGGTQRLAARAGDGRAREAVLTGRTYDAETMQSWGVVNRVVSAGELQDKTKRFALELASGPTVSHHATKRVLDAYRDEGLAEADRILPAAGAPVLTSADLNSGIDSLLEKGPGHATFDGV